MNKKYFTITWIGLAVSLCISIYIINKKHEDEVSINKSIEQNHSEKVIPQNKNIMPSEEKIEKPNNKTNNNTKNMTPSEYIAWVKDPNDRVLLEIKKEGTKIYRKGDVTITVTPDGKELYMPDEL